MAHACCTLIAVEGIDSANPEHTATDTNDDFSDDEYAQVWELHGSKHSRCTTTDVPQVDGTKDRIELQHLRHAFFFDVQRFRNFAVRPKLLLYLFGHALGKSRGRGKVPSLYIAIKLPCCDVRKMPSSLRTQVTQGRRAPQGQDRFESSKQNYLVLF